ncbi:hypothetical protein FALCPG4_005312 [Fusarium falciforme]
MRKIRCDKDWPCSNCRIAKRSCTSTGVGQRPKEPRQRVLISSQYERKIDQIETRLGSIETILRDLAQRPVSTPASNIQFPVTPQQSSAQPGTTTASTVGFESSDDESAFGGDSVIAQQTNFASEFLEHAVERTSLQDVSPKMWEALTNLRQLAELQNRQSISHGPRFPLQQPIPQGGLVQLRMPPMDVVVSLLKRIRASPPGLFTFVCYFVGISDFSNLCRLVYFPTDDFSDSAFIIVNAGLYYLFLEQHTLTDNEVVKEEFVSYLHTCRVNLETALAKVPLFMSAKIETVQALLLGTLYAIDVCRPSVAWHLNSAAAQLCLTAGFHRKEHSSRDPEGSSVKGILFWYIYTTDKALGIRLGRAPVIQDWDIDIPRTFNFEGILSLETKAIATMWLKAATLQGRVYEQLFCPAALAQPQAVIVERARLLATECRQVVAEATESRGLAIASLEKIGASPLVDVHVKGDEVQLLSTMTLIYRAIPAPEGSISRFCDECVESARRAIHTHLACMEMVRKDPNAKTIYVHWNLVLTPFAPFFVLFCYVIETLSAEDLDLLNKFAASIAEAVDSSETMTKLFRLCHVMSNVAALYVEAKSQQQEDQAMVPIGDEFEVYLSQLGFMPTVDQQAMNAANDPNAVFHEGSQVAQMADWMSGSRNLLGLLEEDISQIGGPQWPGQM